MFRAAVCKVFGLGVLLAGAAAAQQYVISTYAGGPPLPAPAPALSASIGDDAESVAVDSAGNAYFTSSSLNCVFKLDAKGVLTRFAGNGHPGYSGDGGPAAGAQLAYPEGVAVDGSGNVFIADSANNRIRRVSPDGIITTVAGIGTYGASGDSGPATGAQLSGPQHIAADAAGNLFLTSDSGNTVRKVSPDGIITTLLTPAQLQQFASWPQPGLAADNAGDLFLTDGEHGRVLKVSPNGTITTVAGNGTRGFSGDGGTAASAQLNYPVGVAVDSAGNLFMVDNDRIRKISPDGTITTVAGNGGFGFSGDGGTATAAQLNQPFGVAVDGTGNLFIADTHNFRIRKVSPDATISTVAGGSTPPCCSSGDGGPATIAQLTSPADVAVDTKGNVFIADGVQVRRVSPDGVITTAAGNGTPGFSGDGGPATAAQLGQVGGLLFSDGIATDGSGNLFIADCNNFRVRKVAADGTITTIAGNGVQGYSGDGGPAITAQLGCPFRLVADAAGNLFVMDDPNHPRIRKVSRDGTITTVAGNGKIGFSGDGGPATSAALDLLDPNYCGFSGDCAIGGGMAVDGGGNLMFADTYNDVVREVSSSGIITTVVGGGKNSPGDGGPATSAQLFWPFGVAFDGVGNLFIAEVARIRKVSPSGTITTVAGSVVPSDVLYAYSVADYFTGYSGDGGPATGAAIGSPGGIALDGAGNIYFADPYNKAVRVLRPANHSVVIGAVVDAASQSAGPVSPGKIVVIYGAGLGPAQLVQNQASNGLFGASAGGTSVLFNGIAAPVLYASDTQVAAIVPYSITTTTAQVTVTYQGETSAGFSVTVAPSAPSLFTLNQTGAGQAAAINAVDGTPNSAANPVKIGGYISLYATGEGQTAPAGVDGKLSSTGVRPALPVSATIGGFPATVQFAGEAPGQVAGLMQVNLQVPSGVQTGGYVPVVLQVGNASTTADAVWIAVSGN